MLPPFIIDQIRKREEEEKWQDDAPRLEIPMPPRSPVEPRAADDEADRGVIIIDLVG